MKDDNKSESINKIIKVFDKVLEKHKDKSNVKDAYFQIQKLKEKRQIK